MIKHPAIIAIPSLLCMVAVPPTEGRDFLSQFQPSVSIIEKYTDNLDLTATDKKDDYITTIQPGIKFSNMDQASGVEMDYVLGLVNYGKNSDLNYISHNGNLNAKMLTPEHINFYLVESFTRSDEPRERELFTTTEDNKYVLATQQVRAVYWRNAITPTVEYLFGPENSLAVTYRNNLYRTQNSAAEDSQENFINPVLSYWFNKKNGISIDYGLTYGDFQRSPDMVGHRAKGRYTMRLNATSSILGQYTFLRRMFESSLLDYDVHESMIGFAYNPTPLLKTEMLVGYYLMNAKDVSHEGFNYQGSLRNLDPRTQYQLSLQGGYTEDYFTSQNLGFNQYHRLTGSLTHMLAKYTSISCLGSISRAEYNSGERDTMWSLSGVAFFTPLRWLTLRLEISHLDNNSNVASAVYTDNEVRLIVTATY